MHLQTNGKLCVANDYPVCTGNTFAFPTTVSNLILFSQQNILYVAAASVVVVGLAATIRGKRDAKQTKLAHSCYFFFRAVYWIVGKCNHYIHTHRIILSDVSFIYLSQFVCAGAFALTVYQRYYHHFLFIFDLVFSIVVGVVATIRSIATA